MSDQPPVPPPPPPTQPTPPVPPPPPTQPAPPPGGATWQGVQPVVERPTEAEPPVPPGTPPPAPPTGGGAGGASGGGPSKGLIALIVVVLVAVLGVGGFLLFGGDDDDNGDRSAEDRDRDRDDEDDDEETTTTTEPEEETTTTSAPDDTTTSSTPDTAPGGELTLVPITDDTGTLVVQVPDTWTDVDGRPLNANSPNVQASTDLAAFRALDASGVSFSLLEQQNADPDTTLDFLMSGQVGVCETGERIDYTDGVFTGRAQELLNCGDSAATLVIIVASNAAGQTVEVSTIIVDPDPVDQILQAIAGSFNLA